MLESGLLDTGPASEFEVERIPLHEHRPEDPRVAAPVSARGSLESLREAAARCKACPLWHGATQTVFGEGDPHASLLILGEQPGHNEDLSGRPFVGPAGLLFEKTLKLAGLDRESVYVTNAVKHFKWELRGKRRLHKTPVQREIEACNPWLDAELDLVKPRAVLCLGATAARAMLGGPVRVGEHRGHPIESPKGYQVVVTVHPAYILRLRAGEAEAALAMLTADVELAARLARAGS